MFARAGLLVKPRTAGRVGLAARRVGLATRRVGLATRRVGLADRRVGLTTQRGVIALRDQARSVIAGVGLLVKPKRGKRGVGRASREALRKKGGISSQDRWVWGRERQRPLMSVRWGV